MSDNKKKKKPTRYLIANETGTMYGAQIYVPSENGSKKLKTVLLYNGYNSVPLYIWETLKENPVVKRYIDAGKIFAEEKDISEMRDEMAINVISKITDPRYLKIIKSTENRASVSKAASERYDRIIHPTVES